MHAGLSVLLLLHAGLHLIGVAKGLGFMRLPGLQPITRAMGVVWWLAALAFATGALMLNFSPRWWWTPVSAGVVLSQLAIGRSWSDAKFGTAINALLAFVVVLAAFDRRPSSYSSRYERLASEVVARSPGSDVLVSEQELSQVPPPVARYLQRVGVVGTPHVRNFRARMRGQIKREPDGSWLSYRAQQVDSLSPPARVFLLDATQFGVPFEALHSFVGPGARMEVRVLSLFDLVDARSPQMSQSETVTLFNDLWLLAPAALLNARVSWSSWEPQSVRCEFEHEGVRVAARVEFDAQGELRNFVSEDRFLSADGKKYERYPWSTPVHGYERFEVAPGHFLVLPARGEATWQTPSGVFTYASYELTEIRYDVGH